MRRLLVCLLFLVMLLAAGCNMPSESKETTETTGETLLTVTESAESYETPDLHRVDETFDFYQWLDESARLDNSDLDLRSLPVVSVASDRSIQSALATIEVAFPLTSDEQILRYVQEVHEILATSDYLYTKPVIDDMRSSMGIENQYYNPYTDPKFDYELIPDNLTLYTNGILRIDYYLKPNLAAMLSRDGESGVFPIVFVSTDDGRIMFITYA